MVKRLKLAYLHALPLALLIFLLVTSFCVPTLADSASYSATPRSGQLVHDGVVRTYMYYVPDGLPDAPVPLVFMLHGGGGTSEVAMSDIAENRWNELADQYKFIVIYPQGVNNHWNDCRADYDGSTADDVGFIDALITRSSQNYRIDQNRIYATGHSNGGMMSMRLAIELSDRLAAVFSCAGPLAADSECRALQHPVSVMFLAGTADPVIPFDGGEIAAEAGGHGTVLSANATVDYWTHFLGTDAAPTVTKIPDTATGDHSTVTIYRYDNGADGTEVLYYRVDGGGHAWPSPTQFSLAIRLIAGYKNQDMVACDEAWAFFQQHPKQPTNTPTTTTAMTQTSTPTSPASTSGTTTARAPGPDAVVAVVACVAALALARRPMP